MSAEKIRILLLAGIVIPVVYFGLLIIAPLLYPGYSHVTQYASELGSADARYPAVFNTAVMLCGLAGLLASFGFFHAVRRLGGNTLLAALTRLTYSCSGSPRSWAGGSRCRTSGMEATASASPSSSHPCSSRWRCGG